MIKKVVTIALGLSIFLGVGCQLLSEKKKEYTFNPQDYYDNPQEDLLDNDGGIVRLYSKNEYICTAVIISNTLAVTAAHCLQNADNLSIKSSQEVIIDSNISVVGLNNMMDFAVISGNFYSLKKIAIDTRPLSILTLTNPYIVHCGYPLSGALLCLRGNITGVKYFRFNSNTPAYPGMSGGAVISLETGKLIGVISSVGLETYYSTLIEIFADLNIKVRE